MLTNFFHNWSTEMKGHTCQTEQPCPHCRHTETVWEHSSLSVLGQRFHSEWPRHPVVHSWSITDSNTVCELMKQYKRHGSMTAKRQSQYMCLQSFDAVLLVTGRATPQQPVKICTWEAVNVSWRVTAKIRCGQPPHEEFSACPVRILSIRMTGDWESTQQLAINGLFQL